MSMIHKHNFATPDLLQCDEYMIMPVLTCSVWCFSLTCMSCVLSMGAMSAPASHFSGLTSTPLPASVAIVFIILNDDITHS